jgi:hypothetical protein
MERGFHDGITLTSILSRARERKENVEMIDRGLPVFVVYGA